MHHFVRHLVKLILAEILQADRLSSCTPTGYKIHIELPVFAFVSRRARPSSGKGFP